MTNLYIFISIFIVSMASLAGIALLLIKKDFLQSILMYLVSFAVGALFANVFLHILPEIAESSPDIHTSFGLVLLGIIISFMIEKFIHWHHCHNLDCSHSQTVGIMMIIGDGVHNVTDGVLIATAYLVDIQLGIATTIAVILHEIPQEIGDFAVLLHSGFSRGKALLWNFISALTAFAGAFAVVLLHEYVQGIDTFLLPIVAGNFLYIAGSDLIPVLHKESRLKNVCLQLVAMIAGISVLYILAQSTDAHQHAAGVHDTHEEEVHHLSQETHLDHEHDE